MYVLRYANRVLSGEGVDLLAHNSSFAQKNCQTRHIFGRKALLSMGLLFKSMSSALRLIPQHLGRVFPQGGRHTPILGRMQVTIKPQHKVILVVLRRLSRQLKMVFRWN